MNKSSMRLLVAVGLIALLACSWFMLISNTQKANNAYMTQLDAARAKIKQGLYEDALDFYAAATEQRDSIELRDEIAQVYQDNAGEFRFRLKAKNGQIIAASEGYTAVKSCLNGVESVRKNVVDAKEEMEQE